MTWVQKIFLRNCPNFLSNTVSGSFSGLVGSGPGSGRGSGPGSGQLFWRKPVIESREVVLESVLFCFFLDLLLGSCCFSV